MPLYCGKLTLTLDTPKIMGVLNITPDSFSDGGELYSNGQPKLDAALARAEQMIEAGASILDVGGESTRPNAKAVSVQEEIGRVLPVIEALARRLSVVISIDSSRPEVMAAAAQAGAGLINDVRALQEPNALEVAAGTGLPVVLMHMQGEPTNMQKAPAYKDITAEVMDFLAMRKKVAIKAGIKAENIILDPGIGFGKTLEHNLQLMAHLSQMHELGSPLLLGISRKSTIGAITNRPASDRLAGSLAGALAGVHANVQIIRVHDVAATTDAIKVWQAIWQAK